MIEAEILEILGRDDGGGGSRLNELADEFRSGRDIRNLVLALDSERADVVSTGVWILGELPFAAYNTDEFISRLHKLLEHPDPGVRFHAVSAIFPALDPHEASTQELLQKLCNDTNKGVRMSARAAAARLGLWLNGKHEKNTPT